MDDEEHVPTFPWRMHVGKKVTKQESCLVHALSLLRSITKDFGSMVFRVAQKFSVFVFSTGVCSANKKKKPLFDNYVLPFGHETGTLQRRSGV